MTAVTAPAHRHVFSIPLLRVTEQGKPVLGVLGSQIGYRCACGAEQIKWPNMAANTAGVTEQQLLAENARRKHAAEGTRPT